ncbi:MAG: aspartate/glutamate racemase family protein [Betaproteobacteria bacterium]
MRILVVNANTSNVVTEKVTAEAQAAAAPDTTIVAVTGTFGARVIGTRSEHAIAEHSTIALVAGNSAGCDAVVVAVSYDTGVRGARELLSIPVVGMTEAGLLTACMLGGRIGVVTFGRRVLPLYHELVASYGLAARIAGWRVLESTAAYGRGAHPGLDREIIAAANDLVVHDFAETIVLTGAVMAGVPRRLQRDVPVPIIDCIGCGVRQAELLAGLALPKPSAGSYAAPAGRELVAVDPAIAACFARATEAR